MAAEVLQPNLRVLIVDHDEVVRDMLAADLSAAGYEVDTLSSGNGFTADMVELIHPDLLLVDPFLPDVPFEAVTAVLQALHVDGAFKLVLIDGGQDPERLAALARDCRADGSVTKRDLLNAPADAVAEQLLPEVEIVEEVAPLPSADVAMDEGLEIELTADPPARRLNMGKPPTLTGMGGKGQRASSSRTGPAAPPAAKPAATAPSAAKEGPGAAVARPSSRLARIIEDEVGQIAKAPAKAVTDYQVDISLFSRNNFYVGPTGDLRTGGVFIATSILGTVGDRLRLVLQLPFAAPLEVEGAVEWVRPGNQAARVTAGIGVSLAHLPADWRSRLEIFFRERAPLRYTPQKG